MKILCVGEAMAEIRADGAGFAVSFAGDTYNTAVYCRRILSKGHSLGYLTRVGQDPLSQGFLDAALREGVGTEDIKCEPARNIGIYSVQTDPKGERSFAYWRNQSAARLLFQSDDDFEALDKADLIYFSGITLAIIDPERRRLLLDRLGQLRRAGRKVAFDSNYRPRLWESAEAARQATARALQIADIALPSLDDELALFGDRDEAAALSRLRSWDCTFGTLKRGAEGPTPLDPDLPPLVGLAQAVRVVDTTAAGDSFNGGYLAAHMNGADEASCIRAGHELARHVVGQPGAIVDTRGVHGMA